ncbi:hypothetical protein [Bacillus velezensis]|uniref:hypothetical protein n=1 Tax=Bacillus velezensis TaxID=492670 RepID=UPI0025A9F58C|nr:hypothetical protein [Bacillus velezensis]
MLEQNIKLYVESYLSQYNQIIDSLYRIAYSTNPEAFRLKDRSNIKIYLIKLSSLLGSNNTLQLYLTFEKNKNLELEIVDLTNKELYEDYSSFSSLKKFIFDKSGEKDGLKENNIIYSDNISFYKKSLYEEKDDFVSTLDSKEWQETINAQMHILASEEGKSFIKHVNHPVSYYAKNAARYSYSLLDLKAIINTVNDEDFSYQMDQAIAAYENSLYLASCATLGVCLETLCKLLLKENGVKVKDSDGTMLDRLGERLREQKIISYKFKSRIDVCYKVRNLSSHTSPGKVLQGDCHFIIATINEIVDTYFK